MTRTLRIIVADNDPHLCQFYQQFLPMRGHQVCVASSSRQLVDQCRLLSPDLVIAGVSPPELDGVAAAEEISREWPVPVILVSGGSAAGLVESAVENPCIMTCLFKPVKEADLAAAIAVSWRRFEQLQAMTRETAELRQRLEDRKFIERAKGAIMRYTGLDEEEAYRRMRKQASDQNEKLADLAQRIVSAAEVFHQLEQAEGGGSRTDGGASRGSGRHGTGRGRLAALPGQVPRSPAPLPQNGQQTA